MPFGSNVAIVVALTLALTASTAAAQEDGVTVDPNSPAGKEYVLPIDQARRDAADGGSGGGAGKRDSTGARPTPAFGEGVRPETSPRGVEAPSPGGATTPTESPAPSRKSARTRTKSSPPSGKSAQTPTPARREQERGDIDRALVKASVGDDGEGDGSLALLAGGVAVMVLGVTAGLALRRRAG